MTLNDWCALVEGVNESRNPPLETMSADRLAELKARYPDEKPNG